MKPPPFEYEAPRNTDEAVAVLAQHGDRAKVLAGGQSLVPLLNFRLAQPEVLVDVNRVAELAYVRPANGGLAIGALTRQHVLERDAAIRARLPIVAEASRLIGHLPIRHRGTVGGSLAHADPASELPAVMVALEAELTLSRKGSRRTVAADQFFTGIFSTALEPEELLTDIRVPGVPPKTGSAFLEIARRAGDFALVGVAALVTLDDGGRVTRARLALCGAGPTPVRAREAERVLVGERPDGRGLDDAIEKMAAATDPPSDIHASAGFRTKLARHVGRQAIELAVRRAGGVS
jgi:aerobic carbon-monoxide dehydrogenase medium subunit